MSDEEERIVDYYRTNQRRDASAAQPRHLYHCDTIRPQQPTAYDDDSKDNSERYKRHQASPKQNMLSTGHLNIEAFFLLEL